MYESEVTSEYICSPKHPTRRKVSIKAHECSPFQLYVMTVMATTTMAMKNYEDPVRTRTNAKDSMQTGHLIRTAGCAFPHPREDMRRLGESGTNNEVRRTVVLKR